MGASLLALAKSIYSDESSANPHNFFCEGNNTLP